jgi:hypothetical protein
MAGNAVAAPVGRWVLDSIRTPSVEDAVFQGFGFTSAHGFVEHSTKHVVEHEILPLAINLKQIVDTSNQEPLSSRAASGLVRRLRRSGKPCPPHLLDILMSLAGDDFEVGYRTAASGTASTEEAELEESSASDPLSLFG